MNELKQLQDYYFTLLSHLVLSTTVLELVWIQSLQTTPTSTASLIGIDFAHENKLVYVQMKRNEKDRRRANMKHTSKTTTNSIYIIMKC